MKQIGQALAFHDSTYGVFPPRKPSIANSAGASCTYEGIGWQIYILPYLEQQPLWDSVVKAYQQETDPFPYPERPRSELHVENSRRIVSTYVCPEDGRLFSTQLDPRGIRAGYLSYVGMTGYSDNFKSGMFGRANGVSDGQIVDGLGNTVAIGERPPANTYSIGWWYTAHQCTAPNSVNDFEAPADTGLSMDGFQCGGSVIDWPGEGEVTRHFFMPGSVGNECDNYHYWSLHDGGANFVFADGSVRFLTYNAKFILRNLATISGGEATSSSEF